VDWNNRAQDRDQFLSPVNTVVNRSRGFLDCCTV
jgi:hypothetical protein